MADEQDSDSCVGYHVWVQVPFSALYFMNWCYLLLHQFFYSLKNQADICANIYLPILNILQQPLLPLINNSYLLYNRLFILINFSVIIYRLDFFTYLINHIHAFCHITKASILSIKICTILMNYKKL